MSEPLTAADVAATCGLDDTTRLRLETYVALLRMWQDKFNLVGRSTLADPWRRHILDSAQLWPFLPKSTRTLVDLGSGAGFPGLVLAIMGVPRVTLVEATGKKCAFLREVARATETDVEIVNARLEAVAGTPRDVVTARALAALPALLGYARGFIGADTVCLFLKGASVERELTTAACEWKMTTIRHPSVTHPDGVLLELRHAQARKGR